MRAVRSKGTGPERAVAAELRRQGLPYRSQAVCLPGRPDFAVAAGGRAVAVFVHGCFWHRCPRHGRVPRSSFRYPRGWWAAKLARNVARDRAAARVLRARGWRVCVVWEHETRDRASLARAVRRIGAPAR